METLRTALESIEDPWLGCTWGQAGVIQSCQRKADVLHIHLRFGYPIQTQQTEIQAQVRRALPANFEGEIQCHIEGVVTPHVAQAGLKRHAMIKNIIAVGSGKGGVGKSTVAVNLAMAMRAEGAQVGLLDADIYGASVPRMLGVTHSAQVQNKRFQPTVAYGLPTMSIGYLIDAAEPMIWRGPMVSSALQQLLHDTDWPMLDYLVVDLPPGTGDIQLTLAQKIPVSGALIVTTPQQVALAEAEKGLRMFQKVGVHVLGLIENMSGHICTACGHSSTIFGVGGGKQLSEYYEVPLMGQVPLDAQLCLQSDTGMPAVIAAPMSDISRIYRDISRRAMAALSRLPRDYALTIKVKESPSDPV